MTSIRTIVRNRSANHEYQISDTYEAGISLQGTEVKAIRAGKANLREGWVDLSDGQAFLCAVHISPYTFGNVQNHEPLRRRRLLLNHREIVRLKTAVEAKGMTLVPLSLYFKGNHIKLELGLGKGKKLYDKRASLKGRDMDRAMERALR